MWSQVVDGIVDMPLINGFMPDKVPDQKLDTEAIAETYWQLHLQSRRCFTFEMDARPCLAQW